MFISAFLEMRNAMKTTPLTSYTTCILRKGKASLTPERMFWDTCSRYVWCPSAWHIMLTEDTAELERNGWARVVQINVAN